MKNEKPQGYLTLDDYKPIKKLYDKAVKDGQTQFTYMGQELLTSYAKYLLEYMEIQMRNKK